MSHDEVVDRDGLLEFLHGRHRWVLSTTRSDGRPQMSLVTGGTSADGRLVISTYPERAKARNARRDPRVSVAVLGDEFNSAWVQVDGTAEVLDMPEAADAFVEYYRSISGEHPDWDEYVAGDGRTGQVPHRDHPDALEPGQHRRLPAVPVRVGHVRVGRVRMVRRPASALRAGRATGGRSPARDGRGSGGPAPAPAERGWIVHDQVMRHPLPTGSNSHAPSTLTASGFNGPSTSVSS